MTFKNFLAALISITFATGTADGHAQVLPVARDVPYLGPITLHVDATDVDHKLLVIHETLPVRSGRLTLLYPEWIPGNHAPTNEVKRLAGLRISAGGKALGWQRDPANLHAFQVEVPEGVQMLDIEFQQLLPRQATGDDAFLKRDFASMQWQGAVLVPAGFYASRIDIDASLRLPKGWRHASALRPATATGDDVRFERVSLETLIDSPVFAGRHFKRIDLDPGATRPVHFDLFATDARSLETTEPQIEAYRNLVRQADRLFGARHFAHYDLMLVLDDDFTNLALEHHQSSENGAKARHFIDWATNAVGRTLVPHEYAHSWNGKFRRPRDLWAPDFNVPTRNSLLWVYEGQAQYWGEVLAARAGLIDVAEVRERFARVAAWAAANPGRAWRNLADTAHDAIMAGRRAPVEWQSWQRFEDYYDEGSLLWLDVDTRIREASNSGRSLDDFARGFFGMEDGRVAPLLYDLDDVVAQLGRVQRLIWTSFVRARLEGAGLDPHDILERSGWRLAWTDQLSALGKSIEAYRESNGFFYSLGFAVDKKGRIGGVVWNSPAFNAGMADGLTLVAVNLREYRPELLNEAITAAKDGAAPIELLLKDGADFRLVRIDYRGGIRYPKLERIDGKPDLLTQILLAR